MKHGVQAGLIAAAVILAFIFPPYLVLNAHRVNGHDGFPLDDPWIHLTYARNLEQAHTFSYFPGAPRTQGSTSPLYTFLLAAGFLATHNEKTLSYVLGLLFHAAFLVTLALWARRKLTDWRWAAAAVLIVGFDPSIGILAVSGMETSLFLFLVSLAFWARSTRRPVLTAGATALSVWTRPDGMILFLLFGIDGLIRWRREAAAERQSPGHATPPPAEEAPAPRSRWVIGAGVAAALVLAYFLFNEAVGGHLFPNTLAAKTAYYRPRSRLLFLRSDAGDVFFTGAWRILLPFWLYGMAAEAAALFRAKRVHLWLEAAWSAGLPVAYLVMLPFAHRFGRYLIPAVPAATILALDGIRKLSLQLATRLRRDGLRWRLIGRIGSPALLLAALALQVGPAATAPGTYSGYCRYHQIRHERTGRWLAENTPPDAVIATHDVGAIAYYSGRRIVDIDGVVLPEVVPHIKRPDYIPYLLDLFRREKVTYVAVLRNWCEVVNVAPLFVADPNPEIMEVFPWIPGRTHLMPRQASLLNREAAAAIQQRDLNRGISAIQRSLSLDGESCRTWMLAGIIAEMAGDGRSAEESYRRALALYPGFDEAGFRLASILAAENRAPEAKQELEKLLKKEPPFPGARELYRRLSG